MCFCHQLRRKVRRKADRFTCWYTSQRNTVERLMPGWTISPGCSPGILMRCLAKGFLIRTGMSTLQNYSWCSLNWLIEKSSQVEDLSGCNNLIIIFIFPSGTVKSTTFQLPVPEKFHFLYTEKILIDHMILFAQINININVCKSN